MGRITVVNLNVVKLYLSFPLSEVSWQTPASRKKEGTSSHLLQEKSSLGRSSHLLWQPSLPGPHIVESKKKTSFSSIVSDLNKTSSNFQLIKPKVMGCCVLLFRHFSCKLTKKLVKFSFPEFCLSQIVKNVLVPSKPDSHATQFHK